MILRKKQMRWMQSRTRRATALTAAVVASFGLGATPAGRVRNDGSGVHDIERCER